MNCLCHICCCFFFISIVSDAAAVAVAQPSAPVVEPTDSIQPAQTTSMDITETLQLLANASANMSTTQGVSTQGATIVQTSNGGPQLLTTSVSAAGG